MPTPSPRSAPTCHDAAPRLLPQFRPPPGGPPHRQDQRRAPGGRGCSSGRPWFRRPPPVRRREVPPPVGPGGLRHGRRGPPRGCARRAVGPGHPGRLRHRRLAPDREAGRRGDHHGEGHQHDRRPGDRRRGQRSLSTTWRSRPAPEIAEWSTADLLDPVRGVPTDEAAPGRLAPGASKNVSFTYNPGVQYLQGFGPRRLAVASTTQRAGSASPARSCCTTPTALEREPMRLSVLAAVTARATDPADPSTAEIELAQLDRRRPAARRRAAGRGAHQAVARRSIRT